MKKLKQLTLILALAPMTLFGQTNLAYGEGEIIKKDESSIKCLVELSITYGTSVSYKMSQDGKESLLKSSEIKSIRTPYKYIENITLDNKERLMAMVADGKVKLFNQVITNSGRTELGYGGTFNFNAPPTIIYALKKESNYFEIKKKDFKVKLSGLLNDQPSITERINSKEFKFDDIEKIINGYNEIHRLESLKRKITAKVIDSETKKPIKDVRVTVMGTNAVTTTNFLGFFEITIDTLDILLLESEEYEISQIKVPAVNNFQTPMTKVQIKRE